MSLACPQDSTEHGRKSSRNLGRLDAPEAGEELRECAAPAIFEAGGSFSQLRRSGQWHSSAFYPYLDLGRKVTQEMAPILIEASDDGH